MIPFAKLYRISAAFFQYTAFLWSHTDTLYEELEPKKLIVVGGKANEG